MSHVTQNHPTDFGDGEWVYPDKQEPIYQRVPMDRDIVSSVCVCVRVCVCVCACVRV